MLHGSFPSPPRACPGSPWVFCRTTAVDVPPLGGNATKGQPSLYEEAVYGY